VILCNVGGKWFLSTGINRLEKVCWVRCSPQMPHFDGFQPLPPAGAVLYGNVPLQSVTFFPEMQFRGAKVNPEFWKSDSAEPILQCRLMGWDAHSAGYSHDEQVLDGWERVGSGDGAIKWVHVDELEKLEGPPPEGPF